MCRFETVSDSYFRLRVKIALLVSTSLLRRFCFRRLQLFNGNLQEMLFTRLLRKYEGDSAMNLRRWCDIINNHHYFFFYTSGYLLPCSNGHIDEQSRQSLDAKLKENSGRKCDHFFEG